MEEWLDEHADLIDLKSDDDVLEAGCGTGKTTAWLVKHAAPGRVTAVDFAASMVQRARAKGIDADFACRDLVSDDLGRDCFDVVFCFHAFPHFRDQPAALAAFARALRSGGRLLVLHVSGSRRINEFHAGLEGPVRGDVLPEGDARWRALLTPAGLSLTRLIDRDDLFFAEAVR